MSASDRCKMAAVLVAHSSSCCRCGSPLRTPEITAYPCLSRPILAYHILSLRIPAYHDLIHPSICSVRPPESPPIGYENPKAELTNPLPLVD